MRCASASASAAPRVRPATTWLERIRYEGLFERFKHHPAIHALAKHLHTLHCAVDDRAWHGVDRVLQVSLSLAWRAETYVGCRTGQIEGGKRSEGVGGGHPISHAAGVHSTAHV